MDFLAKRMVRSTIETIREHMLLIYQGALSWAYDIEEALESFEAALVVPFTKALHCRGLLEIHPLQFDLFWPAPGTSRTGRTQDVLPIWPPKAEETYVIGNVIFPGLKSHAPGDTRSTFRGQARVASED